MSRLRHKYNDSRKDREGGTSIGVRHHKKENLISLIKSERMEYYDGDIRKNSRETNSETRPDDDDL